MSCGNNGTLHIPFLRYSFFFLFLIFCVNILAVRMAVCMNE